MSKGRKCAVGKFSGDCGDSSILPSENWEEGRFFTLPELAAEREAWIRLGHEQAAGYLDHYPCELCGEKQDTCAAMCTAWEAKILALSPAVPADEQEALEKVQSAIKNARAQFYGSVGVQNALSIVERALIGGEG